MGNRAEQVSGGTVENRGTGSWGRSMNQEALKRTRDRQGKDPDPMDNVVRAASRRERITFSMKEFEETELVAEERRRAYYDGLSATLQHGMPEVVGEKICSDYVDPNEKIKKEVIIPERQEDIAIADFNDRDRRVGNISPLPTRVIRTILSFFSNQG